MFKLSKDQIKAKDEHVTALAEAHAKVVSARAKLAEAVRVLHSDVIVAEGDYNTVVEQARSWVQEVADEARSAYDEKTERWQEGENGQVVDAWISEWEGFDAEDCEIPEPEVEEAPEDASETLDALPDA